MVTGVVGCKLVVGPFISVGVAVEGGMVAWDAGVRVTVGLDVGFGGCVGAEVGLVCGS